MDFSLDQFMFGHGKEVAPPEVLGNAVDELLLRIGPKPGRIRFIVFCYDVNVASHMAIARLGTG